MTPPRSHFDWAALAKALAYLWASPISLLGIVVAPLAWAGGGKLQARSGVVEIYGGAIPKLLTFVTPGLRVQAITLGHVVLARSALALEQTRAHERVHVRQYERWGLLFPFLYFGSSALAWAAGRHPYYDNRFEQAAFKEAPLPVEAAE